LRSPCYFTIVTRDGDCEPSRLEHLLRSHFQPWQRSVTSFDSFSLTSSHHGLGLVCHFLPSFCISCSVRDFSDSAFPTRRNRQLRERARISGASSKRHAEGAGAAETEQGITRRPRRNAVFGRRRKAARVGRRDFPKRRSPRRCDPIRAGSAATGAKVGSDLRADSPASHKPLTASH
jgi:hypothetical protein